MWPRWRRVIAGGVLALGLMLAVVFVVRTEHGTIQIEIEGPFGKVEVDGKEVTITELGKPMDAKLLNEVLEILRPIHNWFYVEGRPENNDEPAGAPELK